MKKQGERKVSFLEHDGREYVRRSELEEFDGGSYNKILWGYYRGGSALDIIASEPLELLYQKLAKENDIIGA